MLAPPPGLTKQDIIERVARGGMRPRFPSGAPSVLVALASACWAHDPAKRPSFDTIISTLTAIIDAVLAATQSVHQQQQQQQVLPAAVLPC